MSWQCCFLLEGGNSDHPTLCPLPTHPHAPLSGHFGRQDTHAGFSDMGAADTLEADLNKSPAAASCAVYRYDGVGHAFLNADEEGIARRVRLGKGDHSPEAVALAWQRVHTFFGRHLQ